MDASCLCGFDNLLIGGIRHTLGDVVANISGKQNTVLGDVTHPQGHFRARELRDIGTINQDPSAHRFIQALNQFQHRRLAAAVTTDKGVNARRLESNFDIVDHLGQFFGVGEGDVFHRDFALRLVHLDFAFLAFANRTEQFAQTVNGLTERRVGAPLTNQLI